MAGRRSGSRRPRAATQPPRRSPRRRSAAPPGRPSAIGSTVSAPARERAASSGSRARDTPRRPTARTPSSGARPGRATASAGSRRDRQDARAMNASSARRSGAARGGGALREARRHAVEDEVERPRRVRGRRCGARRLGRLAHAVVGVRGGRRSGPLRAPRGRSRAPRPDRAPRAAGPHRAAAAERRSRACSANAISARRRASQGALELVERTGLRERQSSTRGLRAPPTRTWPARRPARARPRADRIGGQLRRALRGTRPRRRRRREPARARRSARARRRRPRQARAAACARCHARRSGSSSRSVASAERAVHVPPLGRVAAR